MPRILCGSEKQNQLCQVCALKATLKATLLGFRECCVCTGVCLFFFLRYLDSESICFVIPGVVLLLFKFAGCNKNNRQNKVRSKQSGEDL